jgi:hypothetical protein
MSSFLCLVKGVFRAGFFKIPKCFFMAMFDLKVGWIHFHKRSPRQTKKMFGYVGFVC